MKRKTLLISIVLILSMVLLSACENANNLDNDKDSQQPKIEDDNKKEEKSDENLEVSSYYPIKKNVRYIYEGKGNEFAEYELFTSYTQENKIQTREDNGGTVSAKIIEIKDGNVTQLLSRPEFYYQENLLRSTIIDNLDSDDQEILLKEPIEKGNNWQLKDGRRREITDIEADVITPLGEYKAVEVTTEGNDSGKSIDYYVKDIGLVKTVFISEGMEVTSTLKEIQENAKVTQNIKFFYPDIDDERLHYKEMKVDFKTDDIARMTLEKAYKNTLEDVDSIVLTENTKINYLYLNADGMVYIDLSKEFLSEMNAGAGYESKILESLAATFGSYYNVDRVVLTIDGGDYESGHIILEDGDYLEFNTENAVHKQ